MTQGLAVLKHDTQIWGYGPRRNMMGLRSLAGAALLAAMLVSFKNCAPPRSGDTMIAINRKAEKFWREISTP